MNNLIDALEWRYATKKFDPTKKLSKEKIDILKKAFNLTATSYGLQPIKLIIIENSKIKEDLLPFSMNQKQVKDASHVLVFCAESNINAQYISDYFERVQLKRGTSSNLLAPFKQLVIDEFSQKETTEIFAWAKNQAYLAMGNLLTVCAVEKIDACPMEGFDPQQYNTYLNLHKIGLQAVLVMPVGYRAQDDFFSEFKKVRKNISETVIDL